MKKLSCSLLFLFLSLFSFNESHAFPNMVRHGYTSCVTCHFNASGGGSLRSYGKYIAGETLGIFNDSETALPWIKKPTEEEIYTAAFLGRTVQTLYDTPQVKRGDFIRMQADIETAVEYKTWTALATVGPRLDSALVPDQSKYDLFLRRFYVGKQDLNYSVKFGKFFPEYGIYLPNHNVPTRKGLFFNHNQEPMIGQASYFTPSFDYTIAHIRGSHDTRFQDYRGYSGTIAYKHGESRFGISRLDWSPTNGPSRATGTSLFGTVGYAHKGYTLFEIARKSVVNPLDHKTDSNLAYLESGWEFHKGFVPYLNWEYTKNVTLDNVTHSPGIGMQFMPWTHFELQAQIAKLYTPVGNGYSIFSMFHVYF